jgi:ribose transport system ATP-binding protein
VKSALLLHGLSKAYGGIQALDGASLEIERGAIHALVGGNGSGKSTLIKILAGVVPADAGEIEAAGVRHPARGHTPAQARQLGLHFVHQQSTVFPALTVAENLALGRGFETRLGGRIDWPAVREGARRVLERFEIDVDPDAEVASLNAATRVRIAIARALRDQEGAGSGVLVLDEPTASLPAHEVDVLLTALERHAADGQAILYVTHRLAEVVRAAALATVLRDGKVEALLTGDELNHDTLARLIAGSAAEAAAPQAQSRRRDDVVLEADDGLRLHAGEVVGIAGLLGSGRTRLLRRLFGGERPRDAMSDGIAYVPEDRSREAAFFDLSVAENISVAYLDPYRRRGGRIDSRAERSAVRELMSSFLVRAESEIAPLWSLSGGNQQKVILSRWLQRNPRILLLDEPTQGVDVGARAEIHGLIRRSAADGAAAIVVSSDFEELATLCDRALVLRDGRVVDEVPGEDMSEQRLTEMVFAAEAHASGGE